MDNEFQKVLPHLNEVTKQGGIEALASKLGYSLEDFRAAATASFVKNVKEEFPEPPVDGAY